MTRNSIVSIKIDSQFRAIAISGYLMTSLIMAGARVRHRGNSFIALIRALAILFINHIPRNLAKLQRISQCTQQAKKWWLPLWWNREIQRMCFLRRRRLRNCLSFVEVFRYVAFFGFLKKIFSKTRVIFLRFTKIPVECTDVERLLVCKLGADLLCSEPLECRVNLDVKQCLQYSFSKALFTHSCYSLNPNNLAGYFEVY